MALIGMMMSAALAAGGGSAASQAQTGAPAKAEAAKPKKPKPKLVCVQEAQIGSLFKTRTCATQEEWDKRRERDQEAMSKPTANVPLCSGPNC